MSFRIFVWIALFLGLVAQAPAQEEDTLRIDLRVTATRPGNAVVIDRGSDSKLAAGDRVIFYPLEGSSYGGTVLEVDARSAVVALHSGSANLEVGTRGEALIPKSRFETPEAEERPAEETPPEPVEWRTTDEEWRPEQPLLTVINAVRPEDRPMRRTGRYYVIADTHGGYGAHSSLFFRAGSDVTYENAFGRGGELHLDGEWNHRQTEFPDKSDESSSHLRFDRISYREGGTRFAPKRWEAGRFLQHGMPEFGVLDGVEVSHRLPSGSRYGVSAGFMPEPDEDQQTGQDFQLAGWYQWMIDERDLFSLDTGYQKTWHNGGADRDLLVTKVRYLPLRGWNFHGTAWLDLYTSSDKAKDSGIELTQAHASASKTWESSGVDFTWRHMQFPELLRDEFTPVTLAQLVNDRNDRLAMRSWHAVAENQRAHIELGAWNDEDETGTDGSVGIEASELFADDSSTDLTAFAADGEFSNVLGARLTQGWYVEGGRWDAFYELMKNDQDGFGPLQDELLQHRLHVSRDFQSIAGWSASIYAEFLRQEEEDTWSLGFYLQRSF